MALIPGAAGLMILAPSDTLDKFRHVSTAPLAAPPLLQRAVPVTAPRHYYPEFSDPEWSYMTLVLLTMYIRVDTLAYLRY